MKLSGATFGGRGSSTSFNRGYIFGPPRFLLQRWIHHCSYCWGETRHPPPVSFAQSRFAGGFSSREGAAARRSLATGSSFRVDHFPTTSSRAFYGRMHIPGPEKRRAAFSTIIAANRKLMKGLERFATIGRRSNLKRGRFRGLGKSTGVGTGAFRLFSDQAKPMTKKGPGTPPGSFGELIHSGLQTPTMV